VTGSSAAHVSDDWRPNPNRCCMTLRRKLTAWRHCICCTDMWVQFSSVQFMWRHWLWFLLTSSSLSGGPSPLLRLSSSLLTFKKY